MYLERISYQCHPIYDVDTAGILSAVRLKISDNSAGHHDASDNPSPSIRWLVRLYFIIRGARSV